MADKFLPSLEQAPISLRNMIRRSFETQDAHDEIRAAILDLFEVSKVNAGADISQVRVPSRRTIPRRGLLCPYCSVFGLPAA